MGNRLIIPHNALDRLNALWVRILNTSKYSEFHRSQTMLDSIVSYRKSQPVGFNGILYHLRESEAKITASAAHIHYSYLESFSLKTMSNRTV